MPAEALRRILSFTDQVHSWHNEQCTLAEFCAYIAVDVLAHVDLAAEARVKPPKPKQPEHANADDETDDNSDNDNSNKLNALELVDMAGGGDGDVHDEQEDVPVNEVSSYPARDTQKLISLVLQQDDLEEIQSKARLSFADKQLKELDNAYGSMMGINFFVKVASLTETYLYINIDL